MGEKKSLTVSSKRGLASRVWLQWHLQLLAEWSICSWVAIQCCAYYPKATSFSFKEERCHKLTLIHGKVGYGNLRLVKSHLTMNTQTEDTKAGEDDIAWGRSCSNWIGYSLDPAPTELDTHWHPQGSQPPPSSQFVHKIFCDIHLVMKRNMLLEDFDWVNLPSTANPFLWRTQGELATWYNHKVSIVKEAECILSNKAVHKLMVTDDVSRNTISPW